MNSFQPGDKVIHRRAKDLRSYGTVMDVPPMQQKEGWIAVYFARKVWCKPENLELLSERKKQAKQKTATPQASISDYWTKQP